MPYLSKLTIHQLDLGDTPPDDPLLFQADHLLKAELGNTIVEADPRGQSLYVACRGILVQGAAQVWHDVLRDPNGDTDERITVVCGLAVAQEARRQGVGRRLMGHIATRAAQLGDRHIELIPTLTSVPFYRAIGYHDDGDQMSADVTGLLAL